MKEGYTEQDQLYEGYNDNNDGKKYRLYLYIVDLIRLHGFLVGD